MQGYLLRTLDLDEAPFDWLGEACIAPLRQGDHWTVIDCNHLCDAATSALSVPKPSNHPRVVHGEDHGSPSLKLVSYKDEKAIGR